MSKLMIVINKQLRLVLFLESFCQLRYFFRKRRKEHRCERRETRDICTHSKPAPTNECLFILSYPLHDLFSTLIAPTFLACADTRIVADLVRSD